MELKNETASPDPSNAGPGGLNRALIDPPSMHTRWMQWARHGVQPRRGTRLRFRRDQAVGQELASLIIPPALRERTPRRIAALP